MGAREYVRGWEYWIHSLLVVPFAGMKIFLGLFTSLAAKINVYNFLLWRELGDVWLPPQLATPRHNTVPS
jgi:hypothetical protein